jgi:hypothetical protein
LASRAETPTRRPPVTSFRSAKRSGASSRSSRSSTRRGASGARRAQGLDHRGEADVLRVGAGRPDQRDGLGEVADEVVAEREELRIGALGGERAQERGLHMGDFEIAGDRGERPAAVGIGRGGEMVADQPQLAVARGRQHQPVEQGREGAHHSASSS